MKRFGLLAAVFGIAALGLMAGSAGAVPLATSATAIADSAADSSLVQQVHGCHRNVQRDRFGWHRHVGSRCARVEVGGPPGPVIIVPRRRCYWAGPVRICD